MINIYDKRKIRVNVLLLILLYTLCIIRKIILNSTITIKYH